MQFLLMADCYRESALQLSETDEKVQGFKLGAVDFVTMPFHRDELLVRVRSYLELKRLRHHLEDLEEERTV